LLDPERKLLLVTGHRRESFGQGLRDICTALTRLAGRPDLEIVYPVHPNPEVRATVHAELGAVDHVHLLQPLGLASFVRLMQRSDLILTDSGGIQEEAPSLGKPVLVTRDITERPEAIEAGKARLVGTSPARIVSEVAMLLADEDARARFSRSPNPYGDGLASARIVSALLARPFEEFSALPAVRYA
jgi:UDP-N-acetylglucosamine 2-epimerase (non-hydrolysing)